MAQDDKLERLHEMWMFAGCSKKDLAAVGRAADEVRVPAGTVLTTEGGSGHEFCLILDGTAAVRRGKRKVATLTAGQYFGELSLLDGQPRSATVVAESDIHLLVLGRREFSALLVTIPSMGQKMMEAMAARLRAADRKSYP